MIVALLRSGHCPKTKYYSHRIGMEGNAACERCGEVEGNDHWVECQATVCHAIAEGVSVEKLWEEDRVVRYIRKEIHNKDKVKKERKEANCCNI